MDVEDLPDGLVVADAAARVIVCNSAACAVTGRGRDDLLGADVRQVLPLQDVNGRRWWDRTDPWDGLAIRTGHRERLLFLPPGRELLVTARYVRAGRSQPVQRVVLQLRETDSRRRAEHDHAGLISTVAHELRSPLTSVKGFTATLLRRWDRFTDEQKLLMLATVNADADRVTRLISELLDISRIDAGRLPVRRQVVDVAGLLHGQVSRRVASGQPESRFVVRIAHAGLPEVWADPDRLEQILANLVDNAIRYGAGTVTLTLAPAVLDDAGGLLEAGSSPPPGKANGIAVTVEDEGEGIDEEKFGLVFSKFWRADGQGGSGLGLGLYVVRGLVEAHRGRIIVSRNEASGALFRFTLPSAMPDIMG